MKLNKNGWGTTEMFLLSGGLLIALLVAIFFISKLYGSMENSFANRQYNDLEYKIENAARNFIESNEIEINGEYKLTLNTLKNNNYISEFKDNDGNNCNGYVLITNTNGINNYNGYILCNDYQTKNY